MSKVVSSVKGLIIKDQKFLLLKERIGEKEIWDLPGGKIEYGEIPQEALQREIKEELWIKAQIIKSAGVYWFFSTTHRYQVIAHTFICHPPEKFEIDFTHNPADENFFDYKWLSKEEFLIHEWPGVDKSLKLLISNLEIFK